MVALKTSVHLALPDDSRRRVAAVQRLRPPPHSALGPRFLPTGSRKASGEDRVLEWLPAGASRQRSASREHPDRSKWFGSTIRVSSVPPVLNAGWALRRGSHHRPAADIQ